MKILCLFVRHGPSAYPESVDLLNQWYAKHGLTEQRTLWIIDNALDPGRAPEGLGPHALLRAGDNRAWEFSAWDQALRQARAERVPFDVVHFVTSAFNTLYTGYLDHFHSDMLAEVVSRKICLGHVDSYTAPVRLEESESQTWVRTCFFFLGRSALDSLPPFAAYANPAIFFSDPASREFRPTAPLSANYQQLLTAWLEGQEMGGHRWHSPVQRGLPETKRFQGKVLAILNEHKLAINLRRAGIPLVDFCWLHSMCNSPTTAFAALPVELDQLKIRRRILGMPD